MEKLYRYLEKNGYEFYREKFGDAYFPDENAQIKCAGAVVAFCYTDDKEECRETVKSIERLESYCKRYGYLIFSRYGWYGTTTFRIMKASDYETLDYLKHFTNQARESCEKTIHFFRGIETPEQINERLSGTIEFYQDEYLQARAALDACTA